MFFLCWETPARKCMSSCSSSAGRHQQERVWWWGSCLSKNKNIIGEKGKGSSSWKWTKSPGFYSQWSLAFHIPLFLLHNISYSECLDGIPIIITWWHSMQWHSLCCDVVLISNRQLSVCRLLHNMVYKSLRRFLRQLKTSCEISFLCNSKHYNVYVMLMCSAIWLVLSNLRISQWPHPIWQEMSLRTPDPLVCAGDSGQKKALPVTVQDFIMAFIFTYNNSWPLKYSDVGTGWNRRLISIVFML